jgi:hypothetical protein
MRYVAVAYATIVSLLFIVVWSKGGQSQSLWSTLVTATTGAAVLELGLVFLFCVGWRQLWQWFPALHRWIFPDINGEWRMEIYWRWKSKTGCIPDAIAIVKLDFLRASMEVATQNSGSQTLIVQPRKDPESGAPLLYYVYLVQPKAIGSNPTSPYHGAAILKFSNASGGELSGNYWTSQQTTGHFRLYRNQGAG